MRDESSKPINVQEISELHPERPAEQQCTEARRDAKSYHLRVSRHHRKEKK